MSILDLNSVGGALAAVGALGTAAYGLADATKALPFGGISWFGYSYIRAALAPFEPALRDTGTDWRETIFANWINGKPKDDQKAEAKSLIRLGLSPVNAEQLATYGRVDASRLRTVMEMVNAGQTLEQSDIVLLARFDSAIDARLDGAFERGDQSYRNLSKVVAGVFAILLALFANHLLAATQQLSSWKASLVGIIAVPIAPVAKDLANAISTAASALKVARA